MGEIDTF